MTRRSRSARGAKQARASDIVVRRDRVGWTKGELDELFENAVMPLHVVAADGTILRTNRAELEMLGYSSDEYVGTNIVQHHVDPAVGADILDRLTRGETIRDYHTKLRCKDGSIKDVQIDSSVLRRDGRFVHTFCFTRDVTKEKRVEDARRRADQRKDEFLATLAHELRNPLAPILNASELLRLAGEEPEQRERALAVLERQVQQMVRLIDDLLDVSRISRGRLELRKERVALAAAIESAVESSRPLIDAREHQLTLEVPPEPLFVHADMARLAQVFANLLNNAAKYTDRGRITLAVERRDRLAIVCVKDTGMGIPPAALPHIFEMFAQVDNSLERAQGGLGIGLSLVRALVEMHGGTVEARSEGRGQGSEFIVTLPLAADQAPRIEGVHAVEKGENGEGQHKRRVLIVDDNTDSAESLATMLKLLGHEVRAVYDGLAALDAAQAFLPDAVLLDIGLPKLNGYEAAKRLRELPCGRDLLLIATTGWGKDEDKQRACDAGFDVHLTKPLDVKLLEKTLAELDTRAARDRN